MTHEELLADGPVQQVLEVFGGQVAGIVDTKEPNRMLRGALFYASRGWAVFPCRPGRKEPATPNGFKDACRNEARIRQWWTDTPDANIGIALEASGLAVIDPDRHEGQADGVEALNALEAEHESLPESPLVQTPSGGLHLYFTDDQQTKTGRLADGLDLKAAGGYIVAPPSVFNGKRYQWAETFTPTDLDPPPLPEWVRTVARNGSRPVPDNPPATDEDLRKGRLWLKTWMEQRGASWFEAHGITVEGPAEWDHPDRIRYVFSPCPWNADHQDRAAWIGVNEHGAIVAGCHHNSCPDDQANWQTLRGMVEPERFALTDYGNAERMVRRHGTDILHVHDWGKWLAWDGRRFKPDADGQVFRLAKETARAIYDEAGKEPDEDRRKAIAGHAARSESALKIRAMIDLGRSEWEVATVSAEIDRNPYLFNVANGTLDLKTGDLMPHDRAHRLSKASPVPYVAGTPCPLFESFVRDIMDNNEDLIAFLQRAVGYSMAGLTVEEVLFFLYGTGKNGKTTLVETLCKVFGDYFQKAPTSMITQAGRDGDGVPNDLARLPGVRLAVAAEVEEGRRMKESRIKDLTGGDRMVARFMRQEFFEFDPTHKLWIYGNHKPDIRGTDEGIWRRVLTIPFLVTIPEAKRDRSLREKLAAELPGVLSWCVEGAKRYFAEGLNPPKEVLAATAEYRSEMDAVGQFIEEECVLDRAVEISKAALYKAFKEWLDSAGEPSMSKKAFALRMKERGTKERRSRSHFWVGIGLATDATDCS